MNIMQNPIDLVCAEHEIYDELLELDGKRIVELGCGAAEITREIATSGHDRRLTAFEVDEIQHAANLQISDLPNVSFQTGGAEAIPLENRSQDIVFMFKSLHHVPIEHLDRAMQEIHRVLVPGGLAYISEPLYMGELNDVLRLFHDEKEVREAAFNAMEHAVENGLFTLKEEVFFKVPIKLEGFSEFAAKTINVTHTDHQLSEETYREVKTVFEKHFASNGGDFTLPVRVDLLQAR